MRKFDSIRQLIDTALQFYTRLEKKGLPLEASKALIRVWRGELPKTIADTLLRKLKAHIPFWVEDSSLAQVYKRFFNHMISKESLNLAESMSPFILISCQEVFFGYSFSDLKGLFEGMDIESSLDESSPEKTFVRIRKETGLRGLGGLSVATHIAYLADPYTFTPLTPHMLRTLGIRSSASYMRFNTYIGTMGFRPFEVFSLLDLILEDTISKRKVIDRILGIDREKELLLEAERLWKEGRFYEAHEVLEEVWTIREDPGSKEVYQGIIRVAIALHHYRQGKPEKALRVLKMAIPQMKSSGKVRVNVEDLIPWAEFAVRKLQRGDDLQNPPPLKVI